MADRTNYNYEVAREDGWWTIRVPDLDLTSRSQLLGNTDVMAALVIAHHLGVGLESIDVSRSWPQTSA